MKLSEKNVLIATGVLFVIVVAMLNLGNNETAKQLENQSNIEISSSSYNVNDGKLTLGFEKPTKEFELARITIIDQNSNSFNGEPTKQKNYILIDAYIPKLTKGDLLNIVIEETISTKELKIEYKIPENISITI